MYNYVAYDEENQIAVKCKILASRAYSGNFIVEATDGKRLEVEREFLYVAVDKIKKHEDLMQYGG